MDGSPCPERRELRSPEARSARHGKSDWSKNWRRRTFSLRGNPSTSGMITGRSKRLEKGGKEGARSRRRKRKP